MGVTGRSERRRASSAMTSHNAGAIPVSHIKPIRAAPRHSGDGIARCGDGAASTVSGAETASGDAIIMDNPTGPHTVLRSPPILVNEADTFITKVNDITGRYRARDERITFG